MTGVFLRGNFNTDTERIQWEETQEKAVIYKLQTES